jgi:nicotinamide phosphoribosyltransferase
MITPLTDNPIMDTDSYKASHWLQYPPDVTSMYSYFESRGGRYKDTVLFGLQYYLAEYLTKPITRAHVDEAAAFFAAHGEPFNREGWEYLVDTYGGHFPVRIRAVPEGTVVPTGNVLFDIELTTPDPKVFWIVSWLETLLVRVWYPTTVASRSYYCKRVILESLLETSDDPLGEIGFKLHDFGSRGVSSRENFLGSDTIEGVRAANHYYGTSDGMAGYSIPAAEHSTITMWGREQEVSAYRNFVRTYLVERQVAPGAPKIAACVSDSYDLFRVIEDVWCGDLHDMIKASGGKLVARPDSGDPAAINVKCLQIMDRKLGMRTNTKGFKVLPPYLGLLQGDGINDESIPEILDALRARRYSASNIAFGMGGGLLQQLNRDTQRFAFKCAAALRGGEWVDVSKDPVTDTGKRSKKGHLALVHEGGAYATVRAPRKDDLLVPVYENGRLLRTYTLDEVRAAAMRGLS